ncbi:MAG: pyrroloquinoline quinone precursor peptide PqqA [Rhodospirillales bacterium]|nr:pyrroloquinoline quinone precursor peptide PqqA [Rhodospirillales bacterium]
MHCALASFRGRATSKNPGDRPMAWKRPVIREICIGMEINAYLPGEL